MKIAVVSDTHGNVANFKKMVAWLNKENIQTILHCGDIGNSESLQESLADFKGEFFGVLGNMDKDYRITGFKIEEKVFETKIGDRKIAITHKPEDAKELARSGNYDLVFYGHTHKPWEERIGNCRMINPGELAGQLYKPSFAVYDTATGQLDLKLLDVLDLLVGMV